MDDLFQVVPVYIAELNPLPLNFALSPFFLFSHLELLSIVSAVDKSCSVTARLLIHIRREIQLYIQNKLLNICNTNKNNLTFQGEEQVVRRRGGAKWGGGKWEERGGWGGAGWKGGRTGRDGKGGRRNVVRSKRKKRRRIGMRKMDDDDNVYFYSKQCIPFTKSDQG